MNEIDKFISRLKRENRRRREWNWLVVVEGSKQMAMAENKNRSQYKTLDAVAVILERLERDRADAAAEEQADLRLRCVNRLETGPDADGLDRARLAALLDSAAALTLPLAELRQIAKCKNPHLYRKKLGMSAIDSPRGFARLRKELANLGQKGTEDQLFSENGG